MLIYNGLRLGLKKVLRVTTTERRYSEIRKKERKKEKSECASEIWKECV